MEYLLLIGARAARQRPTISTKERWQMNAKRGPVSLFSCLLLLVVAVQLARGQDKPATFSKEKLEAIPALLKGAVEKKQIGGGAALIAHRGKIVHQSVAGNHGLERHGPIPGGPIDRIALLSKPITSVGIMILVPDGKLSVTDPLSKFVPEFKEMKVLVPAKDGKSYELVDAKREITI